MTLAAQTAHRLCTLAGLACLIACPTADPVAADTEATTGTDTGVTNGDTLADGSADDIDTTVDDTGPDDTATDDTATDDDATTTGPITCVDNLDCNDPDAPICQDETCIPCLSADDPDAACAALDPSTPACLADQCVQCTASITTACEGNTPVCNPDTNACIPCNEHDQCPDSACKIGSSFGPSNNAEDDEGSCFDTDEVTNLAAGASLAIIIGNQPAGAERVYILGDGLYTPISAITVSEGKSIALLAESPGGPVIRQTNAADEPTLAVENDGRLFLHGIEISGNNNFSDPAITVDDARLHAQRSRIIANNGGALSTAGGAYADIENCFLGNATLAAHAVSVGSSSVSLLHTTALTGFFGATDNYVVNCTGGTLVIRNSFLASEDPLPSDINCPTANVTNTASSYDIPGTGNNTLGAAQFTWYEDYATGDLDLDMPPAALLTTATWQDGDPLVDINGDARVAMVGSSEAAGADLP